MQNYSAVPSRHWTRCAYYYRSGVWQLLPQLCIILILSSSALLIFWSLIRGGYVLLMRNRLPRLGDWQGIGLVTVISRTLWFSFPPMNIVLTDYQQLLAATVIWSHGEMDFLPFLGFIDQCLWERLGAFTTLMIKIAECKGGCGPGTLTHSHGSCSGCICCLYPGSFASCDISWGGTCLVI